MFNSPLRYPGGKNKLAPFFAKICIDNQINGHYVEPYSGGASIALFLLLEGFIQRITINDKDKSIYSFWYSVLNYTDDLCKMIRETDITTENWSLQKSIQNDKENANLLQLGFSTLFLNRTNRSGIINGGFIGGQTQLGEYKIDCRFNKDDIISRIKTIAEKRDFIRLLNLDAEDLIDVIEAEPCPENTIFYFDPPYFLKASSLYMNHYKSQNHLQVSEKIKAIKKIKWVVSYDNVPEIKELYSDCEKKEYSFSHTAGVKKLGKELLFFSPELIKPLNENWNPLFFNLRKFKSDTSPQIIYKIKKTKKVTSQSVLAI
jgi:DNA adenine methylase